jgi:crotonobetainyl-CoA:carnitine CoA-transferase CaiB-like acyl-CoA transferase
MAWRTGFEDDLPALVLGVCDPLAGAHTAFATLLALDARAQGGEGMLVESVMVESALNVAAEAIVEYGAGGPALGRQGNRGLDAAPQGAYPGSAEDSWVALAVETDAQWEALVRAVGSPPWTADPALWSAGGRRALHDLIDEQLGAWTTDRTAEEAVASLSAAGVPAEVVIAARDVVHNPQLRHRGLFEIEDHPVTGPHLLPTLPFHFSHVAGWLRAPSPTLGQHNDEVLETLGVDANTRDTLRSRHVIGERLIGT